MFIKISNSLLKNGWKGRSFIVKNSCRIFNRNATVADIGKYQAASIFRVLKILLTY